jgi:ABC-type multidrug transport system fused ATPase/permease subunit
MVYNLKTEENGMRWRDIPKSIWYFLENDKRNFVISFVVLLIVFFYDLVPVFIIGKIVDFFTKYTFGQSLKTFYLYIAFISVSYIIISLIRLKSKNVMSIIAIKARTRAKIWGFERLTEFSLEWHNKENTGNKLQRIFTGSDGVSNWIGMLRKELLKICASIVGVLVFFLFVDFKFMVLILIYAIVFLSIEFFFSKKVYAISNEFNKFNQRAGGTYVEGASNMLSIKALGGEKEIVENVADKETLSRDLNIKRAMANNIKWRWLQVVNGVVLGIFLLLTGFSFISGIISIGMILVFFTYFNKMQGSLSDISDLYTDMVNARSDIGQMMPIFKETEFIKTGNEKFPKDWDKIEIKNAFMEYGSGQTGLRDFNVALERNSKVGIAGSSGSGKSTLAKIILGLYAIKSGEFKIGEKDYYSILHNETLSNITVVLQETELFNLSLRENITMMRNLDIDLLDKAVEISQLKEVIDKLPNGLDSLIGEKGYMLSGGERQRLGIARAIYKNAPIVILDEATSSLDSETEGRVMEKLLGEYGKEKTFLIIAHRLGTLKYTNSISVMENGQVVENESYEKLMNDKNSVFYKMNKELLLK